MPGWGCSPVSSRWEHSNELQVPERLEISWPIERLSAYQTLLCWAAWLFSKLISSKYICLEYGIKLHLCIALRWIVICFYDALNTSICIYFLLRLQQFIKEKNNFLCLTKYKTIIIGFIRTNYIIANFVWSIMISCFQLVHIEFNLKC